MFLRIGNTGIIIAAGSSPRQYSFAVEPPPSDDIAVALVASRTSGPAPLAVHFSAVDTTADISGVTDTFRQLLYTFDYGDSGSGTWPISGGSKNSDVGGPLGAHVFETPGTYTVRCTASRGESSNYQEVTITVTDPDTVYSGTNTVFVSPSANYAGAPAGAQTVTSIPTIVSNRRYVLRRGESFGSLNVPHEVSGVQIVASDTSGEKPVLSSVQIGTSSLAPNANFPNDISIVDVSVSGNITQTAAGRKFLFLRVDQPSTLGYILNSAINYWATPGQFGTSMPYPGEYFLVGCTSIGNTAAEGIFGHMFQSAILGCDFKSAEQHTVRFWSSNQLFIAHSDLSGPSLDGSRHTLKLHGGDDGAIVGVTGTYAGASSFASRHNVIANNVISDTDDNNQFAAVIGPENSIVSQPLEDFIVENNRFKRGSMFVSDLQLAGRRMTAIGNTQFSGGAAASVGAPGLHNEGLSEGFNGPYYSSRT